MALDSRVYVIDDDDAARDALAFLLTVSKFSVAFDSAVAFLDSVAGLQAGCIVTDVRMPQLTGLDLLRRLAGRGIDWPVIVITGQGDVGIAVEALRAGAVDFFEKPYPHDAMIGAVTAALSGERDAVGREGRAEIQARQAKLSIIERQVLDALVSGKPNKTIALELAMSPRTVEIHRAGIMTKMQARGLSHLVRMTFVAGS